MLHPEAFVQLTNLDLLNLSHNRLVRAEIKSAPKVFKADQNKLDSIFFSPDDLTRLEEINLSMNILKQVDTLA